MVLRVPMCAVLLTHSVLFVQEDTRTTTSENARCSGERMEWKVFAKASYSSKFYFNDIEKTSTKGASSRRRRREGMQHI